MFEPPPQVNEFNWHWRTWFNVLYESMTKPVVTIVEDTDMSNSWVNFDTTRKVRYWKDAFGVVHLSGIIKSGTIGTDVFTLPSGYRPDFISGNNFHAPTTSNTLFGEIRITSDGLVRPTAGSNVWFSFDSVTFKAA